MPTLHVFTFALFFQKRRMLGSTVTVCFFRFQLRKAIIDFHIYTLTPIYVPNETTLRVVLNNVILGHDLRN